MRTWLILLAVALQCFGFNSAGWSAPFTRIVSPAPGQCLPGPDVTVRFEAGGLHLAQGGQSLHFKLNDEPFQVRYNGNRAHVFKNVPPGTHTVRMYAANKMHEAIPGTLSVVTFSVGHHDGANAPVPGQPLLTTNLPQGEYLGVDAASVTLDFLVTNAALSPGGYQVAYYVDGRRFLVQDHCGPRHLTNLDPGFHRIKVQLQDANGDVIPGPFNTTERTILVSPHSQTKSSSPVNDGYPNAPRIDSIKGTMTMGEPWSSSSRPGPALADVQPRDPRLTTTGGRSRAGDTIILGEDNLRRVQLPDDHENAETFSVRDGGEPDETETDSSERGEVLIPADEVEIRAPELAQPEPDTDEVEEGLEETPKAGEAAPRLTDDNDAPSTPTVRRRADGTTQTVSQTTGTLSLEERRRNPIDRGADTRTTRTVTVRDDDNTTGPRVTVSRTDDDETTRPRRGANRPEGRASNGEPRNGSRPAREDRRREAPRSADTATTAPAAQPQPAAE